MDAQSVAAPTGIVFPIMENHNEEAESQAQQQGSDKSDDDRA